MEVQSTHNSHITLPTLRSIDFDASLSTVSICSYINDWYSGKAILNTINQGVITFSTAAFADHLLRVIFLKNDMKQKISIKNAFVFGIIEECIYSGLLRTTKNKYLMFGRLLISWILGATATRFFSHRNLNLPTPLSAITLDTANGFIFAFFREWVITVVSVRLGIDRVIFGLCEVCPKKDDPNSLPVASRPWFYKLLSSVAFRAITNYSAHSFGFSAVLATHLFFNFSRTLPE